MDEENAQPVAEDLESTEAEASEEVSGQAPQAPIEAETEETPVEAQSEELAASDDGEAEFDSEEADESVESTESGESNGEVAVIAKAEPEGIAWYIVHTYSGFENKVKLGLEERIRTAQMEHLFGEILVPEESVVELVKGQKRTAKRKLFPSYMLVKMVLTDETWHLVKDTPKVTGFVGGNKIRPLPVSEEEVMRMTNRIREGAAKPKHRVSFTDGEKVRVVDGPFANFNGVVEEVNEDKGKVKVNVSIFGRPTPVELDFIQVEKL